MLLMGNRTKPTTGSQVSRVKQYYAECSNNNWTHLDELNRLVRFGAVGGVTPQMVIQRNLAAARYDDSRRRCKQRPAQPKPYNPRR
ncbi:MAG TPA: hypothetical protein VK963_04580 [Candidatus Saccharimonadales bacterium]|nr:hypothetical protein [Candidatus Saccharimonadales bacterium]